MYYLLFFNGCTSQCEGTNSAGNLEIVKYNYSFDIYPTESSKEKSLDFLFNISTEPADMSVRFLIPEQILVEGVQRSGIFADAEWRRDKSILVVEQCFSGRGKQGRIVIPIKSMTNEETYISLLNVSFMTNGAVFRVDPNCCHKLMCDEEYDCVSLRC